MIIKQLWVGKDKNMLNWMDRPKQNKDAKAERKTDRNKEKRYHWMTHRRPNFTKL